MVFHSHMLNPRAFLEDTVRYGLGKAWASGMPWYLINLAIDNNFRYNPSSTAKKAWTARTGRSWDNVDDPATKTLTCPWCSAQTAVPWTTCSLEEDQRADM